MHIRFITTGGTIDKIYFDALSKFEVGDSVVQHILTDALVDFEYDVVSMFQKDSLEMTEETAAALKDLEDRTIVLTGALTPARFRTTDAVFNVGMAVASVQVASPGVYIAMSGQVFEAGAVRKNRAANKFEATGRS